MSATNETKKRAPALKVRVGRQTASVWKNEKEGRVFYNTTVEPRRYRNAKGEWKSSSSYAADDLLDLAKLAALTHTKVLELQNARQ